jgi:hypothetical protein
MAGNSWPERQMANGQIPTFFEETGSANPFSTVAFGGGSGVRPTFVDVDRDGDLDLVVGIFSGGNIEYFRREADGTFARQTGAANPFDAINVTFAAAAPAAIDYDGDGDLDLVVGSFLGELRLVRNLGPNNWVDGGLIPSPAGQNEATAPAAADWDGDGDDDLAIGLRNSSIAAYRNDGGGAFTQLVGAANPFAGIVIPEWATPSFLDFDGDGDPDLLVTAFYDIGGGPVIETRAFRNDAGAFAEVSSHPFSNFTFGALGTFAFSDLDNDGDIDAVVGSNDGNLRTFRNLSAQGLVGVNGTAGDDMLGGGAGDDAFFLHQGGVDQASGGQGNDGFYFGNAFGAGDIVDGGPGDNDQVALRGAYGLTLAAGAFAGIETLALLSGSDARFQAAGPVASYVLTFVDGNIAPGGVLTVNANGLSSNEPFTANGAAETDGSFRFFGGLGTDRLTGGAQSDGFFFGAGRFNASTDRVDGTAGADDQLALRGDYNTLLTFGSLTVRNIDTIVLVSSSDPQFGSGGGPFRYNLASHNDNVAAGAEMAVTGAGLGGAETLTFNGSAETDGSFRLMGGAAADVLRGGGQADRLYGGLGADQLAGNGGADRYIYLAVTESTAASRDAITTFAGGDLIDLAAIDAISGGGDDGFTFIGTAAFSAAGQARLVQSGADWLLEANVDSDLGADLVIGITTTGGYVPGAGDIIL